MSLVTLKQPQKSTDDDVLIRVNSLFDLHPLDDNCMPPPPEVIPDEFIISLEDVECRISQIDVHKAPGPDGLPNWLLRDLCSYLAGPVLSARFGFISLGSLTVLRLLCVC